MRRERGLRRMVAACPLQESDAAARRLAVAAQVVIESKISDQSITFKF